MSFPPALMQTVGATPSPARTLPSLSPISPIHAPQKQASVLCFLSLAQKALSKYLTWLSPTTTVLPENWEGLSVFPSAQSSFRAEKAFWSQGARQWCQVPLLQLTKLSILLPESRHNVVRASICVRESLHLFPQLPQHGNTSLSASTSLCPTEHGSMRPIRCDVYVPRLRRGRLPPSAPSIVCY
ncbi:hypothetical protein GWK47_003592 [Chionoecetes opilio]|uniref:Uncharacterized protein n=1 Tax=Chionoecetes opilio TaxID=41210 RepID=A0A8J5D1A5_CHIOP|nr:hypothetical protein GWK47_003592 [Chionoecetes opilio]